MKSLKTFIIEKYVTILPDNDDEKTRYAEQVWRILDDAYKYIGGLAGCKTYDRFLELYVEDILNKRLLWKMVRRGDKITAVTIYGTNLGGRKLIALGCLDDEDAKKDLNMIIGEDVRVKSRGAWAEVSGKALGSYLKKGAIVLPNTMAEDLLKKPVQLKPDGYFYTRFIKGETHTKLLVGFPPNGFMGEEPTSEFVQKLKELGKKYESE